jgi:hypothetical protein
MPVFERRPPPLFGGSRKGPRGPFSVVPSLPFVPVVSPPVKHGGSWPGASDPPDCAVFESLDVSNPSTATP